MKLKSLFTSQIIRLRAWHNFSVLVWLLSSVWTKPGSLAAQMSVAPAASAAPTLQITSVSRTVSGISLGWADLGTEFAYTVQALNSLSVGDWLDVPATNPWPIKTTQWTDTQPADVSARFYRVVARPLPAVERGKIISTTLLRSMSTADLTVLFLQSGIPFAPQKAVKVYKVVYETVDPFDARTTASGLLVLPQNPDKAIPLASYQHGTVAEKSDVPSNLNFEGNLGIAFGSFGYASALPDYLGLGDSPGLHPYHHAKTEAVAVIDMLRATKAFCASNGVALNGQLFLSGYSQGGHATIAAHKELEAFHTNEFTITASAPMAGAYDMSGVTANDFFSGRVMPRPYYFIYLLAAYQFVYHYAGSLADILTSPYDTTLPPLLDGLHSGAAIDEAMPTIAIQILKPDYLTAFKSDPNHPLRAVLRENDLYDWTPQAPMHLYHCHGDQDVVFANSEKAYNSFTNRGAAQVELIDPFPQGDHTGCVPFSMLDVKQWFDSLKK